MGEAIGARSIDLEWVQARSQGEGEGTQCISEPQTCRCTPLALWSPTIRRPRSSCLAKSHCFIVRAGQRLLKVLLRFLAAEALRGVGGLGAREEQEQRWGCAVGPCGALGSLAGGLVINAAGMRFCNELGRRDYVTGGQAAHGWLSKLWPLFGYPTY